MDINELKCDILNVLQNDHDSILKKWILSFQEIRSSIDAKIEEQLLYEKDCTKKKSVNNEKVSELQQEINTMKSDVDCIMLQQKVIDKKISNVTKSREDLQNEFEETKNQRNALLSEIKDLQNEIKEKKEKKVLTWDAIKRACNIYKENLDIHIDLLEKGEKNRQYVKFSFFTHNKITRDKYFVILSYNNNDWKVEQIEPKLNKEYFSQLSNITHCPETGRSEVSDITLFLCQIRSIYLKRFIT